MSYYRNQLEDWLKGIRVKTENVLDLGGASNPVRNRVGSWQVGNCMFMDNGKEEAKVGFIPFDINKTLQENFEGYDEKSLQRNFKFDAVFCLEVFEYVWNPVQAIKNIWDFMNNDSVAYISFPSVYPVHQPWEIDYLRFTKQAILRYLDTQGFTQIEITPRIATEGKQSLAKFYHEEGMHPLRGSDLPYDIGYLVKARRLTMA